MINKLIKNILLQARAAQEHLMGLTWGEAQLVVKDSGSNGIRSLVPYVPLGRMRNKLSSIPKKENFNQDTHITSVANLVVICSSRNYPYPPRSREVVGNSRTEEI